MKRQALYACVSCTQPRNPDFKPAGICLACTYHCHEGHEIVELYTKRHFRCDCGNKRFPKDLVCKLASDKAEENQENRCVDKDIIFTYFGGVAVSRKNPDLS